MNQGAKQLIKDIFVFSMGTVMTKLIQFLLMPLYTSSLTTESYGAAELVNNLAEFFYPIDVYKRQGGTVGRKYFLCAGGCRILHPRVEKRKTGTLLSAGADSAPLAEAVPQKAFEQAQLGAPQRTWIHVPQTQFFTFKQKDRTVNLLKIKVRKRKVYAAHSKGLFCQSTV